MAQASAVSSPPVRRRSPSRTAPPKTPLPTAPLKVTHANRVIDPDSGLTKGELVAYYALGMEYRREGRVQAADHDQAEQQHGHSGEPMATSGGEFPHREPHSFQWSIQTIDAVRPGESLGQRIM